MKWQWKLGRFADIDVYIHVTFLLIVGWYGYMYWLEGRTLAAVVEGVALILLLFFAVTLHEYGHALTARKFGIKTRDITLYPVGGVARLERMPDKPIQEFWVALAGPAVNLVIAAVLFGWLFFTDTFIPVGQLTMSTVPFIERLAVINLSLVLFNLLPAFPMDGGRVLRALLAMRLDNVRATNIAATVGQGMAILFGIAGFFGNPFLILIAFFVWFGASQEAAYTEMKHTLSDVPVTRVMRSDYLALHPRDNLGKMARMVLSGTQQNFPVIDNGTVVGIVTRGDLMPALPRRGEYALVAEIMRTGIPVIEARETVDTALMRLQESGMPVIPVVQNGQMAGLITLENISEYLMINRAMKKTQRISVN
jgi:Zn-dependent protease/predicted transcriptional regulator